MALGPPSRSQDPTVSELSGRFFQFVADGGDSVRTNPVHLWPEAGSISTQSSVSTCSRGRMLKDEDISPVVGLLLGSSTSAKCMPFQNAKLAC